MDDFVGGTFEASRRSGITDVFVTAEPGFVGRSSEEWVSITFVAWDDSGSRFMSG